MSHPAKNIDDYIKTTTSYNDNRDDVSHEDGEVDYHRRQHQQRQLWLQPPRQTLIQMIATTGGPPKATTEERAQGAQEALRILTAMPEEEKIRFRELGEREAGIEQAEIEALAAAAVPVPPREPGI